MSVIAKFFHLTHTKYLRIIEIFSKKIQLFDKLSYFQQLTHKKIVC